MVAVFANPSPGFASSMDRRRHHFFEFLVADRLALLEFPLGGAPQKLLSRLTVKVSHSVETAQQIVGNLDLEPGHLARVSRGFG